MSTLILHFTGILAFADGPSGHVTVLAPNGTAGGSNRLDDLVRPIPPHAPKLRLRRGGHMTEIPAEGRYFSLEGVEPLSRRVGVDSLGIPSLTRIARSAAPDSIAITNFDLYPGLASDLDDDPYDDLDRSLVASRFDFQPSRTTTRFFEQQWLLTRVGRPAGRYARCIEVEYEIRDTAKLVSRSLGDPPDLQEFSLENDAVLTYSNHEATLGNRVQGHFPLHYILMNRPHALGPRRLPEPVRGAEPEDSGEGACGGLFLGDSPQCSPATVGGG